MRQHILRGHYPYDSHRLECQQGRGVSRAPRRDLKQRLLEVQVDFMFLGTVGSQYKFLLVSSLFQWFVGCLRCERDLDTTGPTCPPDLGRVWTVVWRSKADDFRSDASDELGTTVEKSWYSKRIYR